MLMTYDSPLAVIMLHISTKTNPNPNANANLKPNCATINEKHDVVHFSDRPSLFFVRKYFD